jgi:hypothetical protein
MVTLRARLTVHTPRFLSTFGGMTALVVVTEAGKKWH